MLHVSLIYFIISSLTAYYNKTAKDPVVHCCDGVLNYNPAGSNVQCCGNQTYDPNKNTCCLNTIHPLTESCCGGVLYKLSQRDVECCQGRLISTTESLCCQAYGKKRIVKKDNASHDLCCGLSSYDSGRKSCCGDTIVNRWNETTVNIQRSFKSVLCPKNAILWLLEHESEYIGMLTVK